MITIKINSEERTLDAASEPWIAQTITGLRREGQIVCVQVWIHEPPLNIRLATPTCAGMGGGGRMPNEHERTVLDLWNRLHLNSPDFSPGNVIAFLKQLARLN